MTDSIYWFTLITTVIAFITLLVVMRVFYLANYSRALRFYMMFLMWTQTLIGFAGLLLILLDNEVL